MFIWLYPIFKNNFFKKSEFKNHEKTVMSFLCSKYFRDSVLLRAYYIKFKLLKMESAHLSGPCLPLTPPSLSHILPILMHFILK